MRSTDNSREASAAFSTRTENLWTVFNGECKGLFAGISSLVTLTGIRKISVTFSQFEYGKERVLGAFRP